MGIELMKPHLRISRISDLDDHGVFGAMTFNGFPFCVTLEPPERDNQSNISCIPPGHYICKPHNGIKYKNTWEITNVPGRSSVLFHAGNKDDHTRGCILLASSFGKLGGDYAILNSGATIEKFRKLTKNETELDLVITENY